MCLKRPTFSFCKTSDRRWTIERLFLCCLQWWRWYVVFKFLQEINNAGSRFMILLSVWRREWRCMCLPVSCTQCFCSQLSDRMPLLPAWLCHAMCESEYVSGWVVSRLMLRHLPMESVKPHPVVCHPTSVQMGPGLLAYRSTFYSSANYMIHLTATLISLMPVSMHVSTSLHWELLLIRITYQRPSLLHRLSVHLKNRVLAGVLSNFLIIKAYKPCTFEHFEFNFKIELVLFAWFPQAVRSLSINLLLYY